MRGESMQFTYRFPAVKGIQAGREYYISMVPLTILPKLFHSDNEIVLPEYRAQRRINEARIPEIKNYILDNRSTYVFSALSASIDGDFRFVAFNFTDVGILEVDMESVFLINDGQHRKAAIEAAMLEDQSLHNETISIVFFRDDGLARSQQMFTDLNKHAVKTSNSLSTLYDTRDMIAVATKNVIDSVDFFTRYTDKERDILGKNSSNLFTLNNIYKANKLILHSISCTDKDVEFLIKYWSLVAKNINEWNELMDKALSKKSLREDYIITLSITIYALGKLGRYFYDNKKIKMEKYLPKLRKIDWARRNRDWVDKTIRANGAVLTGDKNISLTCDMIKNYIGLK